MISYMTTETKNRKKVRKFLHRDIIAVEGGGDRQKFCRDLVNVIFQKNVNGSPNFRGKKFAFGEKGWWVLKMREEKDATCTKHFMVGYRITLTTNFRHIFRRL